jgi:hypothetical protein
MGRWKVKSSNFGHRKPGLSRRVVHAQCIVEGYSCLRICRMRCQNAAEIHKAVWEEAEPAARHGSAVSRFEGSTIAQ